jgi:hypothetical protein
MAIVAAAAAAIVPTSGETVERVYSTGVYPLIQRTITPVSNLLPFAVFDLLTVTGAVALFIILVRGLRRALRERRLRPLTTTCLRLLTAAAVVYLIFLALWGLNYRRTAMSDRLVLDRDPPSTEQVMTLGLESIRRMNALYAEAHRIAWEIDPRDDESLVAAYRFVQQSLNGLPPGAVPGRLKRTIYGPYFRWTSVDGMVDPFALEVLANPDLLPYERTFVAAHEWAHLAGFADEAEANFVAWLTCVRAGPAAQYSGWLSLYWQIGGEVSADNRTRLWEEVAEGPRADIRAISDRLRRGQLPFLRDASWRVYDQYLRANRVEEGVRSYGEVITLIHRARFEDGFVPVRRTSTSGR